MHCCNPKWSNGDNADEHEPEKAHKTVERRTQLGSNLRSLAEVELVEEEIQEPCDRARYSEYAVGGAGAEGRHHVPADKAACSFACNQCTKLIAKSQGYRCRKINTFFNKGNNRSKSSSCPKCRFSNGIINNIESSLSIAVALVMYQLH